jgi:hypothetical protein
MRSKIAATNRNTAVVIMLAFASVSNCAKKVNNACGGSDVQSIIWTGDDKKGQQYSRFSGAGGFVTFFEKSETNEEEVGRCTSFFEFSKVGDVRKAQVWTANHCFNSYYSANYARLALFVDGGYVVNVPYTDNRSVRVNEMFAAAKRINVNDSEHEVLNMPFKTQYRASGAGSQDTPEFRDNMCGASPDEDSPPAKSEAGQISATQETNLCAMLSDTRIFEIVFTSDLSIENKALFDRLLEHQQAQKKLMQRALPADISAAVQKNFEDWAAAFRRVSQLRDEVKAAKFLDFLNACDAPQKPGGSENFCPRKNELLSISRRNVLPVQYVNGDWQKRDIVSEAALKGVTSYAKKYAPLVEQEFKDAYADLLRIWALIRKDYDKRPYAVHVHSNFSVLAGKGTSTATQTVATGTNADTAYLAMPLGQLTVTGNAPAVSFVDGGLTVSFQKSEAKTDFQPGDSGSIFSLYGVVPLAVLTAVNGSDTSGGAVLRPLPKPMPAEEVRPEAASAGREPQANESAEVEATTGSANSGQSPRSGKSSPKKATTRTALCDR